MLSLPSYADAPPQSSPHSIYLSLRKRELRSTLAITALLGLNPAAQAQNPAPRQAPVAQLDRALDYESRGREFESSPARHLVFKVKISLTLTLKPLNYLKR